MSNLREAAQAALEALAAYRREIGLLTGVPDEQPCDAEVALRAALAQQAEPAQDQDVEDAIEAAYWQFDCRKKGLNEWASAPQSERDAFKAEARKLVRGYFPTRQAQDTKREMHEMHEMHQKSLGAENSAGVDALPDDTGRDWSLLEATQKSLREHMAIIQKDTALLRQALEALEKPNARLVPHNGEWMSIQSVAIAALRAALEQAHGIGEEE